MLFALFVFLVAGLHTRLKQSGARHRREPLRQRAAKMEMFSSEVGAEFRHRSPVFAHRGVLQKHMKEMSPVRKGLVRYFRACILRTPQLGLTVESFKTLLPWFPWFPPPPPPHRSDPSEL